jgi:hypothetical protein
MHMGILSRLFRRRRTTGDCELVLQAIRSGNIYVIDILAYTAGIPAARTYRALVLLERDRKIARGFQDKQRIYTVRVT